MPIVPGSTKEQFKEWTKHLGNFDIRLLPFITVHFLLKNSGEPNDDLTLDGPTTSCVFEIKETDDEWIKDVTLIAGCSFCTSIPGEKDIPLYDAKISISLKIPQRYV